MIPISIDEIQGSTCQLHTGIGRLTLFDLYKKTPLTSNNYTTHHFEIDFLIPKNIQERHTIHVILSNKFLYQEIRIPHLTLTCHNEIDA